MAERWSPWRALRDRPHLVFALELLPDELGGGVWWPRGGRAAILVDSRLDRRARKAALAHELVHDERGGGAEVEDMPPAWAAVVVRAEASVEREVARRLVPPDELRRFAVALAELGQPVAPLDVAEHFDTTEAVATRALEQLQLG